MGTSLSVAASAAGEAAGSIPTEALVGYGGWAAAALLAYGWMRSNFVTRADKAAPSALHVVGDVEGELAWWCASATLTTCLYLTAPVKLFIIEPRAPCVLSVGVFGGKLQAFLRMARIPHSTHKGPLGTSLRPCATAWDRTLLCPFS